MAPKYLHSAVKTVWKVVVLSSSSSYINIYFDGLIVKLMWMPPFTRPFSSLFSSFTGTYYIPILELSLIQISGPVDSLFSNQQRLMCLSDINAKIGSADSSASLGWTKQSPCTLGMFWMLCWVSRVYKITSCLNSKTEWLSQKPEKFTAGIQAESRHSAVCRVVINTCKVLVRKRGFWSVSLD